MNINELNRIKMVNIEEKLAGVERGTGTFKEILDNVMNGVIIPLTDNSGNIVGMNFDTKVANLIEDSIEQRKFEIRYCCKPVMNWVLKALELKADRKVIAEVIENDEGIKVVTESGEVIDIETYYRPSAASATPTVELPSEVDIAASEIRGDDVMKEIKKYLRNTYNHYLSGFAGDPVVTASEDGETYHVTNISWGRKI